MLFKYYLGSIHKNIYIGWVNKNGDIIIGCIDYNSLKPLKEFVIKKELQKDDHANPSILILQVCIIYLHNYIIPIKLQQINCSKFNQHNWKSDDKSSGPRESGGQKNFFF